MTNRKIKSKKPDLLEIRNTKELLIALLLMGGLVSILSIQPALLAGALPLAHALRTNTPKNRKKFTNMISYAKNKKYVSIKRVKQGTLIQLTSRGTKHAKKCHRKVRAPVLVRPKNWDKKWRLIMYDIPSSERQKRNQCRNLIKVFGGVLLQKSIWITPFDCCAQVEYIKLKFKLSENQLRLIVSSDIGEDKGFKNHFKLR